MKTQTEIATHSRFSLKGLASFLFPSDVKARLHFFHLFAPVLLLCTLGVSYLNPCVFSPYFPFVALVGFLISLRWQTVGLCVAFVMLAAFLLLFFRHIPFHDRLWEMGIVMSVAVECFIGLLALEEGESLIDTVQQEVREKQQQIERLDQEQVGLQNEMELWHEKAETHRQEIENTAKRNALIQKEIEKLQAEKMRIVNEADEARQASHIHLRQVEAHAEEIARLKEKLEARPEAAPAVVTEDITALKREKSQTEGELKQLRSQFEEKNRVLLQTRRELFLSQGKLEALLRENANCTDTADVSEVLKLQSDLIKAEQEITHLEEELHSVEDLVSTFL